VRVSVLSMSFGTGSDIIIGFIEIENKEEE
jgi:hypothetical protein